MVSSQNITVLWKLFKTSGLLYNEYYDAFEFLTPYGRAVAEAEEIQMCEEFQMAAKHDGTLDHGLKNKLCQNQFAIIAIILLDEIDD